MMKQEAKQQRLHLLLKQLNCESDRGLALIGGAYIDEQLREVLEAFFCRPAPELLEVNRPLGAFGARIDLCFALGLIDDFEKSEVKIIAKIRNEFAHKVDELRFADSNEKMISYCSALRSEVPTWVNTIPTKRFVFENAVVTICLRLHQRSAWVAFEKRRPRKWVRDEDFRWRKTAEEGPPPQDTPWIGITPNAIFGSPGLRPRPATEHMTGESKPEEQVIDESGSEIANDS